MTIDELVALLPSAKPTRRGGFVALCPAHEDRKRSLSVDLADDKILICCFAGCTTTEVMAAIGKTTADLFEGDEPVVTYVRKKKRRVTNYEIRGIDGNLVAIHERTDLPDGSKDMKWKRPTGDYGLNGTAVADLPLYGSEHLASYADVVWIVEGEKDCVALHKVGVAALGTVTGAAETPSAAALAPLSGRAVIVAPDNDAPGLEHMRRVATVLEDIAAVGWVEWPGVAAKGGATDYLESHTADDLRALLATARAWPLDWEPQAEAHPLITPMLGFLAEIDEPVLDVVPGIIPADALILFVGRKESFKSMTAQTLHAAAATGGEWMGMPVLPMRSVYVSNEKRRRSVRERFRTIIGTAALVHDIGIVHRAGMTLDTKNPRWQEFVDEITAMNERVLVTLDTLASLSTPGFKENSPEDMGRALAAIRMLTNLPIPATVALLHHPAWADAAGKEMRGRGHSSLEGEHDGLLSFDRPDRELDEGVIHVRPKDGDYRLLMFSWDRDSMRIVRRDVLGLPLTIETVVSMVAAMGGATVEQVRGALGTDPQTDKPRFSDDRVRDVMNKAVADGRLTKAGGTGGTSAVYSEMPE